MADRRRANRFVLFERTQGVVRLMEDVYVERITASESTVIAAHAAVRGEEVLLEFPADRGRRSVMVAEVVRSSLVPFGGTTRHRVLLRVVHRCAYGGFFGMSGDEATEGRMGVVVRRVPVRITEASASGCFLESTQSFAHGAVGILELTTDNRRDIEPLRITRCARIAGAAWPYRAGAEFLPLEATAPTSLRNTVARLEIVLELDSLVARTSSGPVQSEGGSTVARDIAAAVDIDTVIPEEPAS